MTTLSDIINDTRRLLLTGAVEERNKLVSDISSSDTTASFTYAMGAIDRGAKVSIGLEDMYVWGVSSQTATLDRGQFGSLPSSHAATSIAYVNPKFSNFEIYDAVNKELVAFSSPVNGLFRVEDYVLAYNPTISGYDFPYAILDIYQVRYTDPGPSQDWTISQDWEYTRHAGDDFTSDAAIFIRDAYPHQNVVIKAKRAFDMLAADLSVDVSDSGLPESCYDILSLGAAWRLTSPREVRRNFNETQGDTRRANEVPPGAQLGGSRELGRLRTLRINEEASRLSAQYPARSPRFPYTVGGY